MAYTKQNWVNLPSRTTPLSAARLSHMETQYEQALNESMLYTDSKLGQSGVISVNGQEGAVVLDASDVGAASISRMDEINGLTVGTVHIYVSPLGSDAADGSQSSPFRTVQRAFDSIPKVINKDHTIWLDDGTYDEEPKLQGVNGAGVFIKRLLGEVPASSDTGVRLRSLRFYDCNGYLVVQNVTASNSSSISADSVILFSRCSYGTVNACRFTSSTLSNLKPTIKWDGSGGGANSNYFSSQYLCVLSLNGSRTRVDSTNVQTGGASTTHIQSQAASVFLNGAASWASSLKTIQGGRIYRSNEPFTQRGLSFIRGDNSNTLTLPATWDNPYSSITGVQATFVGARLFTQGAPSSITDFPTNWGSFTGLTIAGTTNSGTTIRLLASTNHGDGYYFGVSWQVDGVL